MYQSGKIYQIKSNHTDKVYIGSTTKPLSFRLLQHISLYALYNENKGHYYTSFDIIKHGDASVELYEDFPCTSKKELLECESAIIRLLGDKCVNIRVDNRTKSERDSRYWNKNKESIKERKKKPFLCECGSTVRTSDVARHLKSKKHNKTD
jgi:hypothetical protein